MISLYIHIPFCTRRCTYCSFTIMAIAYSTTFDTLIDEYCEALKKEITHWSTTLIDKEVKTIYFWWGTPSKIWIVRIIDIIEHIKTKFNLDSLEEFSIELNPDPQEEIYNFVDTLNKKYKDFSRLRYSFGIQSFDDEVLQATWRGYNFSSIVDFLRGLVKYKAENDVFNFDFIAFGKLQVSKNWHRQLWHEFKREFLKNFLNSWYIDSISVYTLEGIRAERQIISPITEVTHKISEIPSSTLESKWHGTDEEITEEFIVLKDMVLDAWYQRYEISNFAKASKTSIHNMVYWNMENYIGIWVSAASFFHCRSEAEIQNINAYIGTEWKTFRRTNTVNIKKYIEWERLAPSTIETLNESDILIEKFFLKFRTKAGIDDITKFSSVLIANYEWLLASYKKAWLVTFEGTKLQLTDKGMNVSNTIITDLLQQI